MGYVIPLVLVVLLVAGFLIYLVLNATRKSGPAADGAEGPGVGADESPLGDTTEHSDHERTEGAPVGPAGAGRDEADPEAAAHVARPGEGEGHERLGFEGEQPAEKSRR
jgi:hypothetical protein